MRTLPDDWLTAMAMAFVFLLIAAAAQWRVPNPLLSVMPSARASIYMQAASATPSRLNEDGSFELGQVLDLLADFAVADVPLGSAIAAERIEVEGPSHRQDFFGVADDEHGADRFALASFAADFRRQFDDGAERFQRNLRVELAEVLER